MDIEWNLNFSSPAIKKIIKDRFKYNPLPKIQFPDFKYQEPEKELTWDDALGGYGTVVSVIGGILTLLIFIAIGYGIYKCCCQRNKTTIDQHISVEPTVPQPMQANAHIENSNPPQPTNHVVEAHHEEHHAAQQHAAPEHAAPRHVAPH